MNLKTLLILVGAAAWLSGCSHERPEPISPGTQEALQEPVSRVRRTTNDNVVITLDAATQSLMGLQTVMLPAMQLNPEVKGYGRVLDISSLAALAAELITARSANESSQVEWKRLKTLAQQNNASQRALEAAEAAAIRDRTQMESARLRLLASWGSAISEQKDLLGFVESLGSLASALVEINLPAGDPLRNAPTGARLLTLAEASTPLEAKFLGPAPTVSPLQGRGYIFLVETNSLRLAAGTAVTGLLSFAGTPLSGVAVPGSAVVQFNGTRWVYRQASDQTFERTEVTLEAPLPNAWFVRDRLKPGDKVVVVGAQQLLSEESKGQEAE